MSSQHTRNASMNNAPARRLFLRQLLGDLFFFGILHSLASMLAFWLYRDMRQVSLLLLLAVPCLLTLAVRWFVDNIFIFFSLHLLLAVWPLAVPLSLWWKAILFTFTLFFTLYSFIARLSRAWRAEANMVVVCVILYTALSIGSQYLEIGGLSFVFTLWAFASIIAQFIYNQTRRVDNSLSVLSGYARHPTGMILRFNNGIIAFFLLLTALVLAFARYLPLGPVLSFLGGALRAIVRFLVSLFGGDNASVEEIPEEEALSAPPGQMDAPPGEPSLFWVILEWILYYAVMILFVVGSIAGVIYLVYKIYCRFYASGRVEGELREYIGPEPVAESFRALWRGLWDRAPSFGESERERVRRAYYKKVRRCIKRGTPVTKHDTTAEIEDKIRPVEDIAALTRDYNKARYGREA